MPAMPRRGRRPAPAYAGWARARECGSGAGARGRAFATGSHRSHLDGEGTAAVTAQGSLCHGEGKKRALSRGERALPQGATAATGQRFNLQRAVPVAGSSKGEGSGRGARPPEDTRRRQRTREGDSGHARRTADTRGRQRTREAGEGASLLTHPPACSLAVLPLCSLASLLTHRSARSGDSRHASETGTRHCLPTGLLARETDTRHGLLARLLKAGTSSTPTGLLAPRPTSLLARLTHPPANSARSRQASALAGGERLPARSLSHRPASRVLSPSRLACLAATRLASLARQLARSRTLLPPRAPCCLLARSLDHRPVSASRLLAYQRAHRPVCASTDLLDW